MSEKFKHIFDIDALGAELGGETQSVKGPGGHKMQLVVWTPELVERLRARIRADMAGDYACEVCHRGSAPMWVMAAAVSEMFPASITFTPPVPGVELKLHAIGRGELNSEAEVEFDVKRRGKTVYISYRADDPSKPQLYGGGHHSYNPELIPLIKAPDVSPDEHICLGGNSSYNVTMSIASAYFSGCASLSMAGAGPGGGTDSYICALSRGKELSPGDVTAKL